MAKSSIADTFVLETVPGAYLFVDCDPNKALALVSIATLPCDMGSETHGCQPLRLLLFARQKKGPCR